MASAVRLLHIPGSSVLRAAEGASSEASQICPDCGEAARRHTVGFLLRPTHTPGSKITWFWNARIDRCRCRRFNRLREAWRTPLWNVAVGFARPYRCRPRSLKTSFGLAAARGRPVDPRHVSGHSLRAGMATTAAIHGAEEREIARTTGLKRSPSSGATSATGSCCGAT